MEEPGQRASDPRVFIKKEARSPLRRNVENSITVVCWALYLYLLLPLFTLVLWLFGVNTIYDQIIGVKGYHELMGLIRTGGVTAAIILLILLGWTYYNYLWYRRRGERRGNRFQSTSDTEIADLLCTESSEMEQIRTATRLEIRIDGPKYSIINRVDDRTGRELLELLASPQGLNAYCSSKAAIT